MKKVVSLPLVSIIVPCYNQGEYLKETLESIRCQTYHNWECVIVDDGSTDDTKQVSESFCVDNRFSYHYQSNSGLSAARNKGITLTSGLFILPLDSDDIIGDTYIEKAVARFIEIPQTKLVYCKAEKFGAINCQWELPPYRYEDFIWNNCIFCANMYKRSDYLLTKGYNENMKRGLEDWDFLLSLLKPGDVVYKIDELLFHYRVHNQSMTKRLPALEGSIYRQLYHNHKDVYEPIAQNIISIHKELLYYKSKADFFEKSRAYSLGQILLRPFVTLKFFFHSICHIR